MDISLGTGGYHFIVYNYSFRNDYKCQGHIMKLRYTPFQMRCFTAEEKNTQYEDVFNKFDTLNKSIVIVGTLHSMVGPIAAMLKYLMPSINITYIMTDGGALPIYLSSNIRELKKKELIDNTITIGHAFGGDMECINIYSGLIAAKHIFKDDVTIVAMGPGIVGTGTKYGFSGIEQGQIIDAVNNLDGTSITVPRISFSDTRQRHKGISHHTITNLTNIMCTKTNLVLPYLKLKKRKIIKKQIIYNKIHRKHNVLYENGNDINKILKKYDLNITTMGRNFEKDKEYFFSLGAVGRWVIHFMNCHKTNTTLQKTSK